MLESIWGMENLHLPGSRHKSPSARALCRLHSLLQPAIYTLQLLPDIFKTTVSAACFLQSGTAPFALTQQLAGSEAVRVWKLAQSWFGPVFWDLTLVEDLVHEIGK